MRKIIFALTLFLLAGLVSTIASADVPDGWTQAPSNYHYAFRTVAESINNGSSYRHTLQLMDLDSGDIQDVVSATSPNSQIAFLRDVSPNYKPVVIYGIGGDLTSDPKYFVFVRRVADPTEKIQITGTLEGIFFKLNNSATLHISGKEIIVNLDTLSTQTIEDPEGISRYFHVKLMVYDEKTNGPVTTETCRMRRVYSIENYSDKGLEIANFGVSGFAMVNIESNEYIGTGGSGNMHYNIYIPPHSSRIVAYDDLTDNGPLKAGYYRCLSGCTIWYSLPPQGADYVADYVGVMPETVIYVGKSTDNSSNTEILEAINNVNANLAIIQEALNRRISHLENRFTTWYSRIYSYLVKIYDLVLRKLMRVT